jgi:hypothetical protein
MKVINIKDVKEIIAPISKEFKVACELYHHELRRKPLSYTQLVKEMADFMEEDDVKKSLDTLFDWGIVNAEFDSKDRKMIIVNWSSRPNIASLYDKYWRKYKLLTQESPLSNPMKVACEIYLYNKKGEDIWGDKLIKEMEGILSKGTINRALDLLYDWQIVTCCGSVGENGKARKLLTISQRAKYMVEQGYDYCWEEYRELLKEYDAPNNVQDQGDAIGADKNERLEV